MLLGGPLSYARGTTWLHVRDLRTERKALGDVAIKAKKLEPVEPKVFDTLFFVHQPKTGTSFLAIMRKYIRSCTLVPKKRTGYTCFGELGGGFPARMTMDGLDHFAYVESDFNVTLGEKGPSESCSGAFSNCRPPHFHCHYDRCGHFRNKVILIRDPFKWFNSLLKWQIRHLPSWNAVSKGLPFTSQTYFAAGTHNASLAIEILQHKYIWWGLTDYWKVSIGLFHRELVGGDPQEDELLNSRSAESSVLNQSRRQGWFDELMPNATEYVLQHYAEDIELYKQLNITFWRRAIDHGLV